MAKFDYPYKKGVNITAWVLQFLVCVILLAASAWLLWLVNQEDYDSALSSYEGLFTCVFTNFERKGEKELTLDRIL